VVLAWAHAQSIGPRVPHAVEGDSHQVPHTGVREPGPVPRDLVGGGFEKIASARPHAGATEADHPNPDLGVDPQQPPSRTSMVSVLSLTWMNT
jgi:hypothetical protein